MAGRQSSSLLRRTLTCSPAHPTACALPVLLFFPVQEEEVRNRGSEALNVSKVSLEGRIQGLEAAVEAQHRVRW